MPARTACVGTRRRHVTSSTTCTCRSTKRSCCKIKSQDVLHSFFLPNLRVKQDVVPGMKQFVWFRANEDRRVRHRLRRAVRLGTLQDARPPDGRKPRAISIAGWPRPYDEQNQARVHTPATRRSRMSAITVRPHDHAHDHGTRTAMAVGPFVRTYVFSLDHKIIGMQFLFSTLLWFLVGGLLALGIRWQLAWPWTRHAGHRPDAVLGRRGPDLARVLHDAVHDARHGDDLLRDHPDSGRGVRQLPDPADDRRRRHGLPDAEHAQLLVHVAGVHLHRPVSFFVAAVWRRRRLDVLSAALGRARSGARQRTWRKRCGCWASRSSASRR